jgi:hypothetical protein
MASNQETGNAINLSNFKKLIEVCTAYGAPYNPSNTDITVANMSTTWTTADTAHTTMTTALSNAKIPINNRENLFDPVDKLVTRTLNYYESTKALKQSKKDAKGFADKYRGFGIKVEKLPDGSPDPAHVSNSQQSYVKKQETFKSLLDLYNSDPLYAPNETAINIATLTTLNGNMKTANDGIAAIIEPVDNLRIQRDHALYDEETGILDLQAAAKDYVTGLFGARAPETKQITSIKFTRKKK